MADDFDIRALPSNFVSKSQPSKIIEKLNEKRKNAHNAAVENMNNRKDEVNAEVDEEIKQTSIILVAKLNEAKTDVEEFLFKLKNRDENELILEENNFGKIIDKISECNEDRKKCIDEFERKLADIEKRRLDSFKFILREAYEKMSETYYKLPFELEEYFENEISNINQISLNNFQKHYELQAELKLQIENDTRLWTQELYEMKENIKMILKKLARKKLLKAKAELRRELSRQKCAMLDKEYTEFGQPEEDASPPLDPSAPVVLKEVVKWIKDIRKTLAAIDATAKNIVHFYKETIVVLFNRFFEEMEAIKKELIATGYADKNDIEDFQSEIYTPAADELKLECQGDFEHLQNVWNNTISVMQDSIDETYRCLKTANGLWENHFQRIEELQKLVVANVRVAVGRNSIASEKFEIKLNVCLDQLRQSPTEEKLEKGLTDSKKMLDNIAKLYHAHATSEMNIVKEYRGLMNSEIDVLMAEIQRFVTTYPPDEDRDPKKQRKRASQTSEIGISEEEALIPPQMMFCQFQVDAVRNWMFGLWEALHQYLSFGREEILTVADHWIDFECERVKTRLEVRLSFNSPRYNRMKCILYEYRQQELIAHTVRFNMHKLAIEERIKGVKEKQKANEEKYNEICKNFADLAEKYESKILDSRFSHQIQRYKGILKNIAKETTESIGGILNENTSISQTITSDLKIANFKYLKAIKLFLEYGNYAKDEAKVLMKNLAKLEKTTAKSIQTIGKEDKAKYNKYNAKVLNEDSDITSMLQEVAEEHLHNERAIKKIKGLHGDIRYDVVTLRSDMKQLNDSLKELVEQSAPKLGDHDFLEGFSNKLQEVVTHAFDRSNFMEHPNPVVIYTSLNDAVDESQVKGDFKDYTRLLFTVRPNLEEDLFLTKLMRTLYISFQDIQTNAKDFYSNHNCVLLDSSKIQPTYNDFMNEVLEKYKAFLMQCEICWTEDASEFLDLLNDLIEFKEDYLSRFEDKLQTLSRLHFRNKAEDIMRQLREEREGMKRKYGEMHQKLKTLHGHPKNRDLLENLQEEFGVLVAETGKKLGEILEPCIAALEEECENTKTVFEETKDVLAVLNQDYGLSDLEAALRQQLVTKQQLMNEMICEKLSIICDELNSDVSTDLGAPSSISKQIVAYMKTIEIPMQPRVKTIDSESSMSERSQLDEFLMELEESCQENIERITDFVNVELIRCHETFQQIWVNEVSNILNLYTVKYDKKNGARKGLLG